MLVTADNIESVCSEIRACDTVALDTETTGIEETDSPFAVIMATDWGVYYFDERVYNFWDNILFTTLFIKRKTWVMQNAKFDMRMLGVKGLTPVGTIHDIAVQARIQRNDHMQYSLEAQGARIGNPKVDAVKKYISTHKLTDLRRDYFGEEYKSHMFQEVPLEIMQPYAEQDARLTMHLYHHYNSVMDAQDQSVMALEHEVTPVLFSMERRGVLVDTQYTLAALYSEQGILNELKERFSMLTGVGFVNSAKTLQAALSIPLPTTAAGNPSLTDDVIEAILPTAAGYDRELLELVREIRHYDKRIGTYYKAFLTAKDSTDTIHCNINQGGTRTGRLSSSNPNMQNLPAEEDSTSKYVARGCFIPRPGFVFVAIDYKQQEFRLALDYAGETKVIDAVMAGADVHQATADLLGISRKFAKTINFGVIYGMGVAKLAHALGVSEREAGFIKTKYFLGLPKLERFIDSVIATGRQRGHVFNWFGRKMYSDFEHCYALPNHLIQGTGADVMKTAMVRVHEFLLGHKSKMVLTIHDELIFEMPEDELHLVPDIQKIMESVYTSKYGMILQTDASISRQSLAKRDMRKI